MAEQCSWSGHVVALVFLKKHIRKFMAVKLDPERAPHTPNGHVVMGDLAGMLGLRVQHAISDADLERNVQHLPLRVVVPRMPVVDPMRSRRINEYAERLFDEEFQHMVDELHYGALHMSKMDAVLYFRSLYNITMEDLTLDASMRSYHRYEVRLKRPLKRGGARAKVGRAVTSGRYVGKRARKRARRS